MTRTTVITATNNGIGLTMTRSRLQMGDCVAALDLSLESLDLAQPKLLSLRSDVTEAVGESFWDRANHENSTIPRGSIADL